MFCPCLGAIYKYSNLYQVSGERLQDHCPLLVFVSEAFSVEYRFVFFKCLCLLATNKNIIVSSFKSSRDIQKKEGGPDSCFG